VRLDAIDVQMLFHSILRLIAGCCHLAIFNGMISQPLAVSSESTVPELQKITSIVTNVAKKETENNIADTS